MIPAYRIHTTKKLAYVRLGGHMRYLGRAGSEGSYEHYRRAVAEWLATGGGALPGHRRESATLIVAQVVQAFFKWARDYYSSNGKTSSGLGPLEAAAKALLALYASLPATEFGPVALRAVRQTMVTAGLCRNVVNQRTACIKRIFRWAVAEELVEPTVLTGLASVDPLRRGRSGVRESTPVRPVADRSVEALLPFLPPTLRAMVVLQRLTGMRSGELCRMRTRDIDRSGTVWVYRPSTHKTTYRGHERLVRIGPQGQDALKPYLRNDNVECFVFSPPCANAERKLMRRMPCQHVENEVTNQDQDWTGCYNPRSYRRALSYAMKRAISAGAIASEEAWHPHQLRHRHATAIRQIKGLEAARVLLGHRTLSQTLEYAEADDQLAASVAAEMG